MRFVGVRIVLSLVSEQIEVDGGLPNIAFHAEHRFAQVEAAGNLPVCPAAVGCSTLDGDKGGNFEILKIILRNLCNFIDDAEVLEGCVLVIAHAGDGHHAALLRRGVGIVAVGEVRALHQSHAAVLNLRRGMDRLPCIELIRDVGNHVIGQRLGRDLGIGIDKKTLSIVRVSKFGSCR